MRNEVTAMTMDRPRLVYVVGSLPHYRERYVRQLESSFGDGLEFWVGTQASSASRHARTSARRVRATPVTWLPFGLRWHRKVVLAGRRPDVVVVEGNPRVLSAWLLLAVRQLWNRPTVLVGHAYSRGGRRSVARSLMSRLSDAVVAYTETERNRLADAEPHLATWATNNGLYRRDEIRSVFHPASADFVAVSRLIPEKKPLIAVEGFARALTRLPGESRLVFVGRGPEEDAIRKEADRLGVRSRVVLTGEISDRDRLAQVYGSACAAISPGYAGLNLTQALGFGVPMIISRSEAHSPEIELAGGEFGWWFRTDDAGDLADVMVTAIRSRRSWAAKAAVVSEGVRERYSVEAMAEAIESAIAFVLRQAER